MKVLVVGSGGREHTIAWKIAQGEAASRIYCAPGNPGTEACAVSLDIDSNDLDGLLAFARQEQIDLTVVGPEAPLVGGISDRFQEEGLLVAGPVAAAAKLEGSKAFAKQFMQEQGIPTAAFDIFHDADSAEEGLRQGRFDVPVVVKADGLAAGKGVFVCQTLEEALSAVRIIMRERHFGAAGARLVIEEFLRGEEASFMVFCDGERALPMVASQDHKTIEEGGRGPNTGGMGAYSVETILALDVQQMVLNQVIEPVLSGMNAAGTPFRGILYAGLMLTEQGPQVLEFNVRLGDPETQVVLPRLDSDLGAVLYDLARGDLSSTRLDWAVDATVCVVLASSGYPGSYTTGFPISGLEMAEENPAVTVFQAGTRRNNGQIETAGGRVLGVTARSETLDSAILAVYEAVHKIHFEGMVFRRDIAARATRTDS